MSNKKSQKIQKRDPQAFREETKALAVIALESGADTRQLYADSDEMQFPRMPLP